LEVNGTTNVIKIRSLLGIHAIGQSQSKGDLASLKEKLEDEFGEDDFYQILESRSIRIQNRVRPIIKAITFRGKPKVESLLLAIQYFKDSDGLVDKNAPIDFLKPAEYKAVYGRSGQFRISLEKALLFAHIQNGIKSGSLNLEHSFKYRPTEDYLISRERWVRDKLEYFHQF